MEKHSFRITASLILIASIGVAAPVTEAEYLSAFLPEHPAAIALTGPLATARGQERSAGTWSNPEIDLDHEAPGEARQLTTTLGWTPPIDERRGLAKRAAGAAVEVAQQELAWSLLELRAEVRRLYAEWAFAATRESLLLSHAVVLRDLVQRADERKRVGEESGLTAQRLTLALVELEANVAIAAAERSETAHAARGRSGNRFAAASPVLPVLAAIPATIDVQSHPRLEMQRSAVESAAAQARFSRRWVHAPQLRLGWQTQREGDFKADGLVAGGAWSVPLFDRQQGMRLEAAGRLRAAQAGLDVEMANTQSMLAGSRESYATLREAALRTAASLQASDLVIERAAARFQMGESDVTDLLDAMRSVLSARMTALDLHGAALAAHRKLELAAGRPLIETPGGGR